MVVFDGKKLAQGREEALRQCWQGLPLKLRNKELVDILVGDDSAAQTYVRLKEQAAQRVGIKFRSIIKKTTTVQELLNLVEQLNNNPQIGGFLLQLPLPPDLEKKQNDIINAISPKKDVDCLTAARLGQILTDEAIILPATVTAVINILGEAGYSSDRLAGEKVCVLGRSSLVGQPLANQLINLGATVTVVHRRTKDLSALTRSAKIIISATGQPGLVTADMVGEGAVVIDVGSPQGDVDYKTVVPKASFITPVPGGVGPVTVASLLENFVSLLAFNEKLG